MFEVKSFCKIFFLLLKSVFNYKLIMLRTNSQAYTISPPEAIFSPSQWLPFDIYEWLPRFPRYAPNPYLLNHISYYYYQVGWHTEYPVVHPHSQAYRMLRAVISNNLQEVLSLIKCGFPINASIDKKYGYNALQISAINNNYPLIELLLLRGAQVDYRDLFGNTPLMLAVTNQNREAIHSLMKNGSDAQALNRYGYSAIDKASSMPSIQQFLKKFQKSIRSFPKFVVRLQLQKRLKNSFWDQMMSMKVYTGKVGEHPLSRWQFDFTDYRQVRQLIV